MKVVSVVKLDKRNTSMSKNFDDDVKSANWLVFQSLASPEKSRSQISDAWSVILTFPSILTFRLKKQKTELKNP